MRPERSKCTPRRLPRPRGYGDRCEEREARKGIERLLLFYVLEAGSTRRCHCARRGCVIGVMAFRGILAIVAVVLATCGAAAGSAQSLRALAAEYYAKVGPISELTGRDTTIDYYERLLEDADLANEPAPQTYDPAAWSITVSNLSQLDESLARQLLTQTFVPMASIRGFGETFVRSSKDGTMQPVAVYVPISYSPERPAPLTVFLHGHFQAESHLIVSPSYISKMAEATGTIVVAPYGRGYFNFVGSEADVYDALEAAQHAFAIDVHRQYLAGYSMGGFAVFRIAPMHPRQWAALMSISGSLLNGEAPAVIAKIPSTRVYVVTGARDETVPTRYSIDTAIFLRDSNVPVSFYSQPDGTHELVTLQPAVERAWNDMNRGTVRAPVGLTGSPDLPQPAPGQ